MCVRLCHQRPRIIKETMHLTQLTLILDRVVNDIYLDHNYKQQLIRALQNAIAFQHLDAYLGNTLELLGQRRDVEPNEEIAKMFPNTEKI